MNIKFPFWQEIRKLLIDRQDGTFAERVEAYPPVKLMTDGDGDYARIRVDVGQTGFFAGREFRTIKEISIASGATLVIKVVATVDTILQMFGVKLEQAELRVELLSGGTEGGTFDTSLPIFKTNTMTTASDYASNITMTSGGTHVGGTMIDLLLLNSGVDHGNQSAFDTVASNENPVGFSAGTFYIKLTNTDGATATGIFRARWEERP